MCSSDERSVSVPVQMAIGAVEVYSLCFTGTFIILVDTLNLSHRFSHRVSKMDCRTVRDRISAWEDQELSPGEASQMADHLAHCSECWHSVSGSGTESLVVIYPSLARL